MGKQRVIAAVVTAAFMSSTGCSFVFVRGPGDVGDPPRVYPDCTDSYAWPVVDGIIGLLSLAAAANPADDRYNSSTGAYESNDDQAGTVAAALITAAAFVGGAIYGYTRVSSCKDARTQFQATMPPQQPYPYGYPPSPYGYPPPGGYQQPGYPPAGYPQQPGYPPQPGQPTTYPGSGQPGSGQPGPAYGQPGSGQPGSGSGQPGAGQPGPAYGQPGSGSGQPGYGPGQPSGPRPQPGSGQPGTGQPGTGTGQPGYGPGQPSGPRPQPGSGQPGTGTGTGQPGYGPGQPSGPRPQPGSGQPSGQPGPGQPTTPAAPSRGLTGGGTPRAGDEGGQCLPTNACVDPTLVCASGLCVKPPSKR